MFARRIRPPRNRASVLDHGARKERAAVLQGLSMLLVSTLTRLTQASCPSCSACHTRQLRCSRTVSVACGALLGAGTDKQASCIRHTPTCSVQRRLTGRRELGSNARALVLADTFSPSCCGNSGLQPGLASQLLVQLQLRRWPRDPFRRLPGSRMRAQFHLSAASASHLGQHLAHAELVLPVADLSLCARSQIATMSMLPA